MELMPLNQKSGGRIVHRRHNMMKTNLGHLNIGLFVIAILLIGCTPNTEPNNKHVVLVMGFGWPAADTYRMMEIPEIAVYEDGLVISNCREHWYDKATICQTKVPQTRIEELINAIATVENFDHSCNAQHYTRYGSGPTTISAMLLNNQIYCGGIRWFLGQPDPKSYPLVENFIAELDATYKREPYQPQQVSVVVSPYDPCDHQSYDLCSNPKSAPLWPYDFSPARAISECEFLEYPLPAAHAIHSGVFRDDSDHLYWVELRPYLPGEHLRRSCGSLNWWPQYKSLPFYEGTHWEFHW